MITIAILMTVLKIGYLITCGFLVLCFIQLVVYRLTKISLYDKVRLLLFRGW